MIVCCPDKIFYDGRTTTHELHHGKRYILLLTIIICVQFICDAASAD